MPFKPWKISDFIGLFRRLVPDAYSVPMETEAGGQGADPVYGFAAQSTRVSEAINTTQQSYFIFPHSQQTGEPASGPSNAQVTLLVSRTSSAGTITIPAGTVFVADVLNSDGTILDGEFFISQNDLIFGPGQLGPVVCFCKAERIGYQGNVRAGSIKRFALLGTIAPKNVAVTGGNTLVGRPVADRITEAFVGRYFRVTSGVDANTAPRRIEAVSSGTTGDQVVFSGPALAFPATINIEIEEWSELGFAVEQPEDAVYGRHASLDAIGEERGVARRSGEPDNDYRPRIASIDDVVSPGAIQRALNRIFIPLGITFEVRETRDPLGFRGFVWDRDPWDFFDIASPGSPVYVGPNHATRHFLVIIHQGLQGEYGFFYDTTNFPTNAYDTKVLKNFYDGHPVIWESAVRQAVQELNEIKAAGVSFSIVRTNP